MDSRPPNSNEAEILLVEDNPGDVRLIEEALKGGKIANTVHPTTDGKEALDFLYQREEFSDSPRPDLILLDLDLPKVNGDEVLSEIKGSPELQDIPVVILTGSEAQADVVKSYELNANAYLVKPVQSEEFIELVRSFEQFWLTLVRLPQGELD